MVVLEPLKIIIENFPSKTLLKIQVPNFPNKPELGSHSVTFGNVIYIERSDFMEVSYFQNFSTDFSDIISEFQAGDKGYRRLTKTQAVGLRHAGYTLEVTKVEKNVDGEITHLVCKCTDVEKVATKPKAFIHWVSDPEKIEVRLYLPL